MWKLSKTEFIYLFKKYFEIKKDLELDIKGFDEKTIYYIKNYAYNNCL